MQLELTLSPEDEAFRDEVRAFLDKNLPPEWGRRGYRPWTTEEERVAFASDFGARIRDIVLVPNGFEPVNDGSEAVGDAGAVVYPLGTGPELAPRGTAPDKAPAFETLRAQEILFRATPVYWTDWARARASTNSGAPSLLFANMIGVSNDASKYSQSANLPTNLVSATRSPARAFLTGSRRPLGRRAAA